MASGIYSTPQEEKIMALAKTLAFLRNASTPDLPFPIEYLDQDAQDAMARELKESGVHKYTGLLFNGIHSANTNHLPIFIMPSGSATDVMWGGYKLFMRLISELGGADQRAYYALRDSIWITIESPQEERDRILAGIISLQMLAPNEKTEFERLLGPDPWDDANRK